MQRKRVHAATGLLAVGDANLIALVDETNGVNFHNVHWNFSVEPQDADANANGLWALWCIPDAVSALPTLTFGALETEGSNPFLWATGTWAAANQSPYNSGNLFLNTSRNCPRDGRLVLAIRVDGISAGQARVIRTLTYNTKSL